MEYERGSCAFVTSFIGSNNNRSFLVVFDCVCHSDTTKKMHGIEM